MACPLHPTPPVMAGLDPAICARSTVRRWPGQPAMTGWGGDGWGGDGWDGDGWDGDGRDGDGWGHDAGVTLHQNSAFAAACAATTIGPGNRKKPTVNNPLATATKDSDAGRGSNAAAGASKYITLMTRI